MKTTITKTLSIKLKQTSEQEKELNKIFDEYKKVVNFFLKKIPELREKDPSLSSNKIRKLLYSVPSRGRKRGKYDVKDVATLPKTYYSNAFRFAENLILKSRQRERWKRERLVENLKKDVEKWNEVLDNPKARMVLPAEGKKRLERYKHIDDKDKPSKGKMFSEIKRIIKKLEKQIKRLLKPVKPSEFKGGILNIHINSLRFLSDKKLKISGMKNYFGFHGSNVKHPKSRTYYKKALKALLANQGRATSYALLKRDQEGKTFILNYPVSTEIDLQKPSKKFKVLGVDIGINHMAVTAILKNLKSKPIGIKFYKNPSLHLKLEFARIRHIIQKRTPAEKERWERTKAFGQKVKNFAQLSRHEISKLIVEQAYKYRPIVIVLEDIKRIKQRTLVRKKGLVKANFKISNADFVDLQRMIEYKAKSKGIPVLYIKPDYTSQECYRHGTTQHCERKGQKFYCYKCRYQINADLNACLNIAKRFYTSKVININERSSRWYLSKEKLQGKHWAHFSLK